MAIVADKMFAMKVFEKHADKPAKYEALRMAARHDMREMAEVLLHRVNSFTDLRIEWGWKAARRTFAEQSCEHCIRCMSQPRPGFSLLSYPGILL